MKGHFPLAKVHSISFSDPAITHNGRFNLSCSELLGLMPSGLVDQTAHCVPTKGEPSHRTTTPQIHIVFTPLLLQAPGHDHAGLRALTSNHNSIHSKVPGQVLSSVVLPTPLGSCTKPGPWTGMWTGFKVIQKPHTSFAVHSSIFFYIGACM